jgi:hypothetical protein
MAGAVLCDRDTWRVRAACPTLAPPRPARCPARSPPWETGRTPRPRRAPTRPGMRPTRCWPRCSAACSRTPTCRCSPPPACPPRCSLACRGRCAGPVAAAPTQAAAYRLVEKYAPNPQLALTDLATARENVGYVEAFSLWLKGGGEEEGAPLGDRGSYTVEQVAQGAIRGHHLRADASRDPGRRPGQVRPASGWGVRTSWPAGASGPVAKVLPGHDRTARGSRPGWRVEVTPGRVSRRA